MRLVLDLPAEWSVNERADGSAAVRAPVSRGSLPLGISALVVRPDHMIGWAHGIVSADGRARVVSESSETTAAGWPVHMVEAEPEEGQPGERRLYAFFHFLDYAAYAELAGPAEAVDEVREAVRAAFLSGRPDWSTEEVVALAQLWR